MFNICKSKKVVDNVFNITKASVGPRDGERDARELAIVDELTGIVDELAMVDELASVFHKEWLSLIRDKYERDGRPRDEKRWRPVKVDVKVKAKVKVKDTHASIVKVKDTRESINGNVNINVEWSQLHPEYKKENLDAAYSAIKAYLNHPSIDDINKAASELHDDWMARNPKATHNEHLHYNYFLLDDHEQDKDRMQILKARDQVDALVKKLAGKKEEIHERLKKALV